MLLLGTQWAVLGRENGGGVRRHNMYMWLSFLVTYYKPKTWVHRMVSLQPSMEEIHFTESSGFFLKISFSTPICNASGHRCRQGNARTLIWQYFATWILDSCKSSSWGTTQDTEKDKEKSSNMLRKRNISPHLVSII